MKRTTLFVSKLNGEEAYMYHPDRYTLFNQIPGTIEGSVAYAMSEEDSHDRRMQWDKVAIPASSYKDNIMLYETEVEMKEILSEPMIIKGKVTMKGLSNISYKDDLLNIF